MTFFESGVLHIFKQQICIWNLSECVSSVWDFDNGVNLAENECFDQVTQEIIDTINLYDPDIMCFQEFPILINGEDKLKKAIIDNTHLKHCFCIDTCPSFLFNGGRIGIATFSKEELPDNEVIYFNNPSLEKVSKSGHIYRSFDKAFIISSLSDNLLLYNCHGISFAPFGKKAKDYPESYLPLYESIVKNSDKNLIITGDLNTHDFILMFPQLKPIITDKLKGATTPPGWREGRYYPKGKKLDSFFVTAGIDVKEIKKVKNFSDHYLCVFTCEF